MGGVAIGVTLNHEYMAAAGLDAAQWQITLLTMIWPVSNILSVFLNHWIDSNGGYSRALLLAAVARLPLALMMLTSSVNLMLLLMIPFFMSNSVVIPTQNAIMRQRYSRSHRAHLFGWWTTVLTMFSLPTAMLVGALLDADFQFYRILFLAEALFGAGQAVVLSIIARGMQTGVAERSTGRGTLHFVRSLWDVFRRDREFARFELFFFTYGVGFLMLLPVVPVFATERLSLSYEEYAMAKGVIGQMGVLLLSPLMGTRLDRLSPFRFSGLVCLLLALYPVSLLMSEMMPSLGTFFFYAAYLVFAVSIAGIRMSWNISSMHFAPPGQEATYQGLHVSLTAVRGCFAPILGSVILELWGFRETFITAAAVFTLAGLLFLGHYRRTHEKGPGRTRASVPAP